VALWLSALDGPAFVASGAMKLVVSKERLALRGASWSVTQLGHSDICGLTEITVSGDCPPARWYSVPVGGNGWTAGLIVVMLVPQWYTRVGVNRDDRIERGAAGFDGDSALGPTWLLALTSCPDRIALQVRAVAPVPTTAAATTPL